MTFKLLKELTEANVLEFGTFYSFCLKHGIDEDDLDDVIDNAYNQDTDEFVLAKDVKQAIGKKGDLKASKAKAIETIKHLAKFTITGKGPGAKKAQALVDKFADAAYKHLLKHWDVLNEAEGEGLDLEKTTPLKDLSKHRDAIKLTFRAPEKDFEPAHRSMPNDVIVWQDWDEHGYYQIDLLGMTKPQVIEAAKAVKTEMTEQGLKLMHARYQRAVLSGDPRAHDPMNPALHSWDDITL